MPFLAAVVLLMLCGPAAAIEKTKAATSKCANVCPDVYEPICGGLKPGAAGSEKPVTFGSACVLSKYNCESSKGELRSARRDLSLAMSANYLVTNRHTPFDRTDFVELNKGECPGKAAVRLS